MTQLHIYIHSFPYYFPLWLIIGYWISFPALYSWTFFSFFNLTAPGLSVACGIYFPDQRSNRGPLPWEHGVLATEPPGKSVHIFSTKPPYPGPYCLSIPHGLVCICWSQALTSPLPLSPSWQAPAYSPCPCFGFCFIDRFICAVI